MRVKNEKSNWEKREETVEGKKDKIDGIHIVPVLVDDSSGLCAVLDIIKRLPYRSAIEQPQNIFPKKASGIIQDESTIMTHQKRRRTNEINYMTNAFVPVVKRRWSAVRMLADSCCRSNCDIFKICP
ncbi:Hypothetical predicted protein [Octopus vulgaris]|uniref:Uncharacterized protein n=1 Tax=Octopus vulgaris TaxID=6645 RepID=A0AA36BLV2_OCTVU|nr:Hypothetical predicted protein [Octopus vulgaris]